MLGLVDNCIQHTLSWLFSKMRIATGFLDNSDQITCYSYTEWFNFRDTYFDDDSDDDSDDDDSDIDDDI
jgi:hypothetical protein